MLHKQLWVLATEFTLNRYGWTLIKGYRHFADTVNTNLLCRFASMQLNAQMVHLGNKEPSIIL